MHPVGFFFSLLVGWLAWRQAVVCVYSYYTILRTRGALPVSKKKKNWGGVGGVGEGFVQWGPLKKW